jgi:FlaA1/EpsC-like NDP-sugar epimerase
MCSRSLISDWENQKEISKVKSIQIEDLLERKPIVLDNKSISKQLKDFNYWCSGFYWEEIVRQVLGFNPKVVVILDQPKHHYMCLEMNELDLNSKIFSVIGDVRNKEAMQNVFQKI